MPGPYGVRFHRRTHDLYPGRGQIRQNATYRFWSQAQLVERHIGNHQNESASAHLLEESDALRPKLVVKTSPEHGGVGIDSERSLHTYHYHSDLILANAPSDSVVGESEHVYFTDPAFGEQSDHRELDFYGVYHLPPRGPMKLVARPAGRPRGIALSPNGRRTDSWLRPVRDVQLVTAA